MEEVVEKKLPVRNLERIGIQKFPSHIEAWNFQQAMKSAAYLKEKGIEKAFDKVKIFARYDNTFDVAWYRKIETKKDASEAEAEVQAAPKQYESKSMERRAEMEKRHGLKAKDRRKAETKKKA